MYISQDKIYSSEQIQQKHVSKKVLRACVCGCECLSDCECEYVMTVVRYTHLTCATSTKNIQRVFEDVRHSVLVGTLASAGVL